MRIRKLSMLLILASVLASGTAVAQETDDSAATDGAKSEQQRADREQMREQRKNMSEEERKAARKKMRARWDNMSDEERQAARDRIRERRNGKHPKGNLPQDEHSPKDPPTAEIDGA